MTRMIQNGNDGKIRKGAKRSMEEYAVITAASFVYALAVGLFLDPNSLAPGGVTGIAIILNRLSGLETGTWILIINLPILALGAWRFGFRFIVSTLYCTALTSFFTNLVTPLGAVTKDPFLAALAGSALLAVGIGLVFKAGATTGGTDIIVKVLRVRFPYLKTGFLFLLTDALIVATSAVVFGDIDSALYAAVAAILTSFILDIVLYGRDGAKLIYIISDRSEDITRRLLQELDIGVTHIQGSGAYSGREKNVILCAIKKQIAYKAEANVKEEDPLAFMIVTSAMEIYGEGYKSYFSELL